MTKIISHWDADGVTGAYLVSFAVPDPKIIVSTKEFGDIEGLVEDGSYVVDMHPLTDFKGTVIDHHDIEGYPLKRSYKLIAGNKPAGILAWEHFKEDIPKSQWWKVAISAVGDGQPELIPYEIFNSCSQLLNRVKTSTNWNEHTFKWHLNYYLVYKLLSSPINSYLRIKQFDKALALLTSAETPMDIINDEGAKQAKAEVKKEYTSIIKNCESFDYANLNVILFQSNYRMSGYIATTVQEMVGDKTVIAINKKDGHGSMRGELALYWQEKLKPLEYVVANGHPGFMGFQLKGVNSERFLEDLTKLLG